ncbi:MAG TPA: HAD-IIIA family hydrolase [Longimicrobiales bacterium]|nr:HAD-IIIA family hydrolase [Longimicrobiales bacterium]
MSGGGRCAVFIDRDGVLNDVILRNGAPESPRSLDQLRLAPDLDAVRQLSDAGLLVFMITNQPDIGRGNVTAELVAAVHDRIRTRVHFDDVRVCTHDDADGCDCRKPKPGMILDLARVWDVDLSCSFVIGDMWRDADAARAAGCRSILIRRAYNRAARPDEEVASLGEAVARVLTHAG